LTLEELGQDKFLLVSHTIDIDALALDCRIKCVVLALGSLSAVLVA